MWPCPALMPDTDAADRPPGWYSNPADAGRLAYWDGRRWTGQHRPRPSWQRADADAEAAAVRDARRRLAHGPRSWVLVGAVFLVIVGLAWLTLPKPEKPGPKVLTDAAFITAANDRCKQTIPFLRPVIETDRTVPDAEIASSVDHVADSLVTLTGQLRALPVTAADQPDIAGWLDGWSRYTDVGHRYAAALRAKDLKTQIALNSEGNKVQQAADRFARANDLKSCELFIKPRGTGGDPFSGGS